MIIFVGCIVILLIIDHIFTRIPVHYLMCVVFSTTKHVIGIDTLTVCLPLDVTGREREGERGREREREGEGEKGEGEREGERRRERGEGERF